MPVSVEESHIQVCFAFEQALEAEDLLTYALEHAEALKRQLVLDGDDDLTPLLQAVSDNVNRPGFDGGCDDTEGSLSESSRV